MIKTNISRWYDVQCDTPGCEMLASSEYQKCIGWALPTQAVNAAIDAGWERREEDGIEHMYCPEHKKSAGHVKMLAECDVCGRQELSDTVSDIVEAYEWFDYRDWILKIGVERTKAVCPDCAKKGQD